MALDPRGRLTGLIVSLVVAWTLPAGCATDSGAKKGSPAEPGEHQTKHFQKPGVYAVDTRRRLSKTELYDRLAEYRYVVIGESHGVEWNHRVQAYVFEALLKRRDGSVALGMEMFQRPYQPALDAYVQGQIDEATMLQRTEYDRRWGVPPRYYRPLWRAARSHSSPVVALNARQELTRAIAQKPLEELTADLKQDLPNELKLYGNQREFLKGIFNSHHPQTGDDRSTGAFERFARAQVVWDATMAETAVSFMAQEDSPASMMIVCGRAHAHRGFGIPPRISSFVDDAGSDQSNVATVLPVAADDVVTQENGGVMADLNRPEAADFLWVEGDPT